MELTDLADGILAVVIGVVLLAVETDAGTGQILFKLCAHALRRAAGAHAAMGRGKGLVQVEVAQVSAELLGAHDAKQTVVVRHIADAQAARLMHNVDKLADDGVEHARVLGVGDEDTGGLLAHGSLQRLDAGITVGLGIEADDLKALGGRSGGVDGVGEDRGDDLGALILLAAVTEILLQDGCVGINALAAAAGLEGDSVETGDLLHDLLEIIDELQHALAGLIVLIGVHLGELVGADELLVDLGAVLHRAGAQADIDVQVLTDGLLGQAQEVTQHLGLCKLRQVGLLLALEGCGHELGDVAGDLGGLLGHVGHQHAAAAGHALLIDDGFVPLCFVEISLLQFRHGFFPLPYRISASASASLSISLSAVFSVTQPSMDWPSCGISRQRS